MWLLLNGRWVLRGQHSALLPPLAPAYLRRDHHPVSVEPMLRLFTLLAAIMISQPSLGQDGQLERALAQAVDRFERALPRLGTTLLDVDVAAYRDALTLLRFRSDHWGGEITLRLEQRGEATGSCSRFAAFVRLPPENGAIALVLCPQFFSPDADALRVLTLLHEMVHVVAGTNECQAMAFAAHVEQAATGSFTPVDRYWQANGCEGGRYRLP
jgi:hypothetical protein